MSRASEFRAFLRAQLTDNKISPTALAERAKVNRATIFRALSDDYEFTPSTKTIDKIHAALADMAVDATIADLESVAEGPRTPFILYSGSVADGVWISETKNYTQRARRTPLAYSHAWRADSQHAFMVADDSYEPVYRKGDFLHVVSPTDDNFAMKPGDHIVIKNVDFVAGRSEHVVRTFIKDTDQHCFAHLGSGLSDADISLTGLTRDQQFIAGRVVGFYRPLILPYDM